MLSQDEALELLNVSPATLKHLVSSRIVLEVTDGDETYYPIEQFKATGLKASFASLLGSFRKIKLSGNEIWSWLTTKMESLEDRTPLEHLEATEDAEKLRMLASVTVDIELLDAPELQRTDWLAQSSIQEDSYTPQRRGGASAS